MVAIRSLFIFYTLPQKIKYSIGQQIRSLEIKAYVHKEEYPYIVSCKCGATSKKRAVDINRNIFGCASCRAKNVPRKPVSATKRKLLPTIVAETNTLFYRYKRNALLRKLVFELTRDDFNNLIQKDCHYCGSMPSRKVSYSKEFSGKLLFNGIDRMQNHTGYTIENSVPCCTDCNFLKGSKDYNVFINKVIGIVNHLNIKQPPTTTTYYG